MHCAIQSGEIPLLKVAVTAIGEHYTLWQRYWKDFMTNRFNLSVEKDKLTGELFSLTFVRGLEKLETNKRLVILHATAYANHIDLAKLVSDLRTLQELQKVETLPVPSMSTQSTTSAKFMSMVEKNSKYVKDRVTLYQFITDTLFEALAGVCLNCDHEEISNCKAQNLKVWRDSYRDVVSIPFQNHILLYSDPYIHCLLTFIHPADLTNLNKENPVSLRERKALRWQAQLNGSCLPSAPGPSRAG